MNINARDLVLEVTRRCNMHCDHCVRGNAQRLDMSNDVLNAVFGQVKTVGSLVFTGGEPSLAVPIIDKVIEHIHMRQTCVMSFFVVTNGKTTAPRAAKFALSLLKLYSYLKPDDEGMTGLTVSGDEWHEHVDIPAVYKGLSFFQESRHGPKDEASVIKDGRALRNGIGGRRARELGSFEIDSYEGTLDVQGTLYIAANGNVTPECDMSFARIDAEAAGNVLKEPLSDIIQRWNADHNYPAE